MENNLEAHCSWHFKTATFSQGRELSNIVHEGLKVITMRRRSNAKDFLIIRVAVEHFKFRRHRCSDPHVNKETRAETCDEVFERNGGCDSNVN